MPVELTRRRTVARGTFTLLAGAFAFGLFPGVAPPQAAVAAGEQCPAAGSLRFGLTPAEDTLTETETYGPFADELSHRLGCPVPLSISESYSATIEAMRAKRLDLASFGPLSYVLAHKLADAEAIAVHGGADGRPLSYYATIVAPKSSGITRLRDVAGHSFVYSDPASTSGHLMPAYALKKAGIDPDTGVRPFFAGSHSASFEALRNHKVDAGELNSTVARVAAGTGEYVPSDFVTLWRSPMIPSSPLCVRGDMPSALKARVKAAIFAIDLAKLPDPKHVFNGGRFVAVRDDSYDVIRDLIATLHIDLGRLGE